MLTWLKQPSTDLDQYLKYLNNSYRLVILRQILLEQEMVMKLTTRSIMLKF